MMSINKEEENEHKMIRRITDAKHVTYWERESPAYKELFAFIKQLNEFIKGTTFGINDIKNEKLIKLAQLLNDLHLLVKEVKPFTDDKNQRFGNKAFRVWFDKMKVKVKEYLCENYKKENAIEYEVYLEESFGNRQRIDYGTGHELSFVIFLMGLYKNELVNPEENSKEKLKSISLELLAIFGSGYLPLVRSVQIEYRLEPAGSHGVYSLDDFQFLPFLFGSAQLIGHEEIEPKQFYEIEQTNSYADQYMFYDAIRFIHKVKTGPFYEHSNQLWNISAVESWSKINRGLLQMYCHEVLHEFPIVQHIYFGEKVLRWN